MAPYAIEVVLKDEFGNTYRRTYSRGPMRLGREAFDAYAAGDLFILITQNFGENAIKMNLVSITEVPVPEYVPNP
jgi:hypothetical protein